MLLNGLQIRASTNFQDFLLLPIEKWKLLELKIMQIIVYRKETDNYWAKIRALFGLETELPSIGAITYPDVRMDILEYEN